MCAGKITFPYFFLLRDFIFQNKLNMKNFKIKTRMIKSLKEEEILKNTLKKTILKYSFTERSQ